MMGKARVLSKFCRPVLVLMVMGAGVPAVAQEPVPAETPHEQVLELFKKIQVAAQELDYSGVYTQYHNGALLSSRVVHVVDGTGERERVEILDGSPREFLTHNDTTQCLIPEHKVVIQQKSAKDRFPSLLLGEPVRIPDHYRVQLDVSRDRIAGRECMQTELFPRDVDRYGYRLCTDAQSNLLLRVQTLSPDRNVLEQIVFTSLDMGDAVKHDLLKPSWDTKEWRIVEAAMAPVDLAERGWRIPFPPGFEPLMQVSRPFSQGKEVKQLVLTDGLAAISVFIEPYVSANNDVFETRQATAGAVNIFRTRIGNHWLTALGEVPALTLRTIAERTEYVPLGNAD